MNYSLCCFWWPEKCLVYFNTVAVLLLILPLFFFSFFFFLCWHFSSDNWSLNTFYMFVIRYFCTSYLVVTIVLQLVTWLYIWTFDIWHLTCHIIHTCADLKSSAFYICILCWHVGNSSLNMFNIMYSLLCICLHHCTSLCQGACLALHLAPRLQETLLPQCTLSFWQLWIRDISKSKSFL